MPRWSDRNIPSQGAPQHLLSGAASAALQGGQQGVAAFMRRNGHPMDGSWCGEFAAAVLQSEGQQPPAHPEVASNWRGWGPEDVAPHPGDIAVRRGTSSFRQGSPVATGQTGSHVTFVGGIDPATGRFQGVGGNQGSFAPQWYPQASYQFYSPSAARAAGITMPGMPTDPGVSQTMGALAAGDATAPETTSRFGDVTPNSDLSATALSEPIPTATPEATPENAVPAPADQGYGSAGFYRTGTFYYPGGPQGQMIGVPYGTGMENDPTRNANFPHYGEGMPYGDFPIRDWTTPFLQGPRGAGETAFGAKYNDIKMPNAIGINFMSGLDSRVIHEAWSENLSTDGCVGIGGGPPGSPERLAAIQSVNAYVAANPGVRMWSDPNGNITLYVPGVNPATTPHDTIPAPGAAIPTTTPEASPGPSAGPISAAEINASYDPWSGVEVQTNPLNEMLSRGQEMTQSGATPTPSPESSPGELGTYVGTFDLGGGQTADMGQPSGAGMADFTYGIDAPSYPGTYNYNPLSDTSYGGPTGDYIPSYEPQFVSPQEIPTYESQFVTPSGDYSSAASYPDVLATALEPGTSYPNVPYLMPGMDQYSAGPSSSESIPAPDYGAVPPDTSGQGYGTPSAPSAPFYGPTSGAFVDPNTGMFVTPGTPITPGGGDFWGSGGTQTYYPSGPNFGGSPGGSTPGVFGQSEPFSTAIGSGIMGNEYLRHIIKFGPSSEQYAAYGPGTALYDFAQALNPQANMSYQDYLNSAAGVQQGLTIGPGGWVTGGMAPTGMTLGGPFQGQGIAQAPLMGPNNMIGSYR